MPLLSSRPSPAPDTGEETVEILAVALNPFDLAIASGRFYGGHPPLPYVPGHEAAVARADGSRAYLAGAGLGVARDGLLAQRVAVPSHQLIPLADGADPSTAVALGTAGLAGWLAVTRRADVGPADVVVVLGATGSVGRIAVQAARLRGASRIVAVGRDPDRLAATNQLADATVQLGDQPGERVLRAAGAPPTVVIDTTWSAPLVAVLGIVAPRARVVHLGASAGPTAELASAAIRSRQVDLLGYSNFGVPHEERAAAHRELVDLSLTGRIDLAVSEVPLAEVADAWRRAATGTEKMVVTIGAPR